MGYFDKLARDLIDAARNNTTDDRSKGVPSLMRAGNGAGTVALHSVPGYIFARKNPDGLTPIGTVVVNDSGISYKDNTPLRAGWGSTSAVGTRYVTGGGTISTQFNYAGIEILDSSRYANNPCAGHHGSYLTHGRQYAQLTKESYMDANPAVVEAYPFNQDWVTDSSGNTTQKKVQAPYKMALVWDNKRNKLVFIDAFAKLHPVTFGPSYQDKDISQADDSCLEQHAIDSDPSQA